MSALPAQDVEALQGQLNAYMERKGLRSTNQRRLVSEVFFRADGHLSIDEMLALVREQDAKVGYATVYRTMKLLVECGLANERQFDDTVTRFEVAHADSHHDHLICLECKRIIEFEDEEIERLQARAAERHGFKLVSHKLELYGQCAECRGQK
ncbi:MAG: transcriptional repressor [Myxococcales bacterium]|nr:transcriptional repressor [Myxococcales bacterium]